MNRFALLILVTAFALCACQSPPSPTVCNVEATGVLGLSSRSCFEEIYGSSYPSLYRKMVRSFINISARVERKFDRRRSETAQLRTYFALEPVVTDTIPADDSVATWLDQAQAGGSLNTLIPFTAKILGILDELQRTRGSNARRLQHRTHVAEVLTELKTFYDSDLVEDDDKRAYRLFNRFSQLPVVTQINGIDNYDRFKIIYGESRGVFKYYLGAIHLIYYVLDIEEDYKLLLGRTMGLSTVDMVESEVSPLTDVSMTLVALATFCSRLMKWVVGQPPEDWSKEDEFNAKLEKEFQLLHGLWKKLKETLAS